MEIKKVTFYSASHKGKLIKVHLVGVQILAALIDWPAKTWISKFMLT